MIRAATKTITINPQDEFYMIGYISPERELPALGVKDDLKAVLLLLEIEGKQLLFVGLDVISVAWERTLEMRRRLTEELNISVDSIVINGIHSHSAPSGFSVDAMGQAGKENPAYCQYVTDRVAAAAATLPEKLTEVTAQLGTTTVHGYYDNRNRSEKYFDDSVSVIRFVNQEGGIEAAMVNLNCHSTVLGPKNRYATGDLLGNVRDRLGESYGVVPYIFAGTIADISNRHYRQGNDFAELARVADGVTEEIRKIGKFIPLHLEAPICREFAYRIAYDNQDYAPQYLSQLETVEQALQGELTPDQRKLRLSERSKLYAKLAMEKVDFTMRCKIYDIGDLRFVTFPGELTSVFGRQIREKSDKKTLIIAYANDHHGYFLEAEEFGHCYESIASLAPKGETEKMIDKLGELL